jgi:hypothetical protein
MYLIVTSTYPSDKVQIVAKRYLEALSKYPPDKKLATEVVPAAVKTTFQGIETIGISEVKKGKLEEAITYIGKMMAMFHDIQGFEYKMETCLTVEEALGMIGMSLPS